MNKKIFFRIKKFNKKLIEEDGKFSVKYSLSKILLLDKEFD